VICHEVLATTAGDSGGGSVSGVIYIDICRRNSGD